MTHELVQLDHDKCVALLASDSVGRLAIVAGGGPHIVPVNYAFDGESIAFRSGLGTKVDAAGRSPASFEVDGIDRIDRLGWSVVAHGRLEHDHATRRHHVAPRFRVARRSVGRRRAAGVDASRSSLPDRRRIVEHAVVR